MEFLSAHQFKLEYCACSGHLSANLLYHRPVEATQSSIESDSRLAHLNDGDVYYIEGPGL